MINKNFFIELEELEIIEQQKRWIDTITLLEHKTKENDDVRYLTRYLAQLCFILSEWDFYVIGNKSDFLLVKNKLAVLVKENDKIFDHKYKFVYSYFASSFPYIFTPYFKEEKKIEENAKKNLKEIYENNKNCSIYKYFYLGTNSLNKKERNILHAKLIEEVDSIFPPNTYVEKYFNSLFHTFV